MRNVWCGKYRECLDTAIKKGMNNFDCTGCNMEDDRSAEPEIKTTTGYTDEYSIVN